MISKRVSGDWRYWRSDWARSEIWWIRCYSVNGQLLMTLWYILTVLCWIFPEQWLKSLGKHRWWRYQPRNRCPNMLSYMSTLQNFPLHDLVLPGRGMSLRCEPEKPLADDILLVHLIFVCFWLGYCNLTYRKVFQVYPPTGRLPEMHLLTLAKNVIDSIQLEHNERKSSSPKKKKNLYHLKSAPHCM